LDLEAVAHDTFQERVGERFTLSGPGGETAELELAEVTPRGQAPEEGGGRQAFSLLFAGPIEPVFEQRVYRLDNDHLGSMELFLVALGPRDGRMEYEAILN